MGGLTEQSSAKPGQVCDPEGEITLVVLQPRLRRVAYFGRDDKPQDVE